MKLIKLVCQVAVSVFCLASATFVANAVEPIHALLITGGGSHDYVHQKIILTEGISKRANVTWKIIDEAEGDKDVKTHEVSIYQQPDWAKGFDVVVHDECFGMVSNVDLVERIAREHSNGVPAVILHCSLHAYRFAKTDEWRKVIGMSSYRHEVQNAFKVTNVDPDHPVMKDFPAEWKDFPDEQYVTAKLWPNCIPLGEAISKTNAAVTNVVIWVNTYGIGRTFGTTLGHGNNTVSSDVYLDLVTRGLLWACGKLDADGKPKAGYGPTK